MILITLPHPSLLAFKISQLRSFCVCEILFCHTNKPSFAAAYGLAFMVQFHSWAYNNFSNSSAKIL